MLAKERGQERVFGVGNDKAKPPMLTAASPGSAVRSKRMASKPFSVQLKPIWKYSVMQLHC